MKAFSSEQTVASIEFQSIIQRIFSCFPNYFPSGIYIDTQCLESLIHQWITPEITSQMPFLRCSLRPIKNDSIMHSDLRLARMPFIERARRKLWALPLNILWISTEGKFHPSPSVSSIYVFSTFIHRPTFINFSERIFLAFSNFVYVSLHVHNNAVKDQHLNSVCWFFFTFERAQRRKQLPASSADGWKFFSHFRKRDVGREKIKFMYVLITPEALKAI